MRNLWKFWLVTALTLTTVYFVAPHSSESKLLLYNGTGLLAVLMTLVGVKINKPDPRAPWLWFAAGLASFLTADIIYYVLELTMEEPPFPSIADFFYLLMYPLVIVGLTKLVRATSPGRDGASFIDAAVVGISMFGALWVLYVDDVFITGDHSTAALITQLAYPVMDVALLAVAARLVVTVHLKHPPFAFMAISFVSLAIADIGYGIANANGTFQTGSYLDAMWLGFYVLLGLAALHPDAGLPAKSFDVTSTTQGRLTGVQLVLMLVATMGVRVIDLFWGNEQDRIVTILASAALFLLILVRVWNLMKALERGRDDLRYEATHDSLTGLCNRAVFAERTDAALHNADRSNQISVLFIDLDDFKTINDSLGHEAGDQLLVEVARRLQRCVRAGDTVARLGGDEFAVLLESAVDRNDVIAVAHRALESLAEPVHLEMRTVSASASIGIAMDLADDMDVQDLLRNADVAMYLSKSQGKGRFEFFENKMQEEAIERLDLKADLQKAVDEQQFVLFFQPIFDLNSGRVTMAEALIRWKHPERGMVMPDRFIPLAEESGLIVPIGEWVLRESCKQAAKWRKIAGCEDMSITVNLSMRQLYEAELFTTLTSALRESGLPAEYLVLEITESMLAVDAERTTGLLEQLKTVGVKLAIDDFGTGYSSFSYLRSFPVDSIKIDRSFINELYRSPTSTALVEAIVNLSKALGAYTVAEGIEHSEQASVLRRLGCDRGQGFYYCRPMAAPAITSLLREHADEAVEPLDAWRRSSDKVQDRIFDIEVHRGLREITPLTDQINTLHEEVGAPLMARLPWLLNWAEAFDAWKPIAVAVRSAESGQLVACAMLAMRERAEGTAIVAMGHGSSICSVLPALGPEAADALAHGIADFLSEVEGTWSLDLEQVNDLDPVMLKLSDLLENAQVLPELRIPRVAFAAEHRADNILSKSMRKQLRRSTNKIHADELEMTIGFDRGRAITAELIDEVEAVHISRDRAARRQSDLDRPSERDFWRRVVEGGVDAQWEVEIATLRLNGELAAYVVALLDGDVYRVYDGRMNTDWQDYSPGRLVESAALNRALADARFKTLDWMNGVAAEKLLMTNVAENRARIVATSGSRFTSVPKRRASELEEVGA
ncbi:MAG: GNAT family N-acetyltransferase [Acidimicrobiales bacterium]